MISYNVVYYIHKHLVSLGVCKDGEDDLDTLQSAINGQVNYNNELGKLTYVAFCVTAYKVFYDGNKLVSFIILNNLNQMGYCLDNDRLVRAIRKLSNGEFYKHEFEDEVCSCLIR